MSDKAKGRAPAKAELELRGAAGTEFLLYRAEDRGGRIEVRMSGETVWLSLAQMTELFGRDKSVISRHIRNVFSEGELVREGVVAVFATTAADGKTYQVEHFNLDVIIFATVQNEMHWAVHGHTAAEVIVARADAAKPNMGLTGWEGARPRRQDVEVAKNYLGADELDTLNRIVNLYLEFAEGQALRRRPMAMAQWIGKLDDFLRISDYAVLAHAGKERHETALDKAHAEYEKFRKVLDELPSPVERDFEAAADVTPLVEVEKRGRKQRKGGSDAA